ncbi:Gag-Pol polyprotein [Frankliniella fusca]|uniref:Gag-Pol polyprotein n=1 Tax=Frankliniella fusca TaxID=407009 RepID=A0AAE1GYA9_9NEOP|nr:Gag-Pol polyprotein [Frankliniella fusca]
MRSEPTALRASLGGAQHRDAETSARAIVDGLVSRFGAFRDIHSDQGCNWEANVFKEVMALLHLRKTRTTPLYPKGNGRCERFVKSLINHLAVVVQEEQRDWPSWIPLILLAYRTAPHSATRFSPAEMLYGRMLSLPADLAREPPPAAHLPFSESEYPRWLRETMRRIHADAQVMREATSRKYKANYDLSTALFPGKPGDAVWLYRPVRKPGRNPKLAPKWEGPYASSWSGSMTSSCGCNPEPTARSAWPTYRISGNSIEQ